jgi:hypothetical protein
MFEQEIELEKHTSSVVPLLLIVALILAIVGVAGYYIIQNRKVLTMQEATTIAASVLEQQGPVMLRFHTGLVKSSVDDSGHAPHYRLLEKAGLIRLGKDTGSYGTTTPVALTPAGEELLRRIPNVSKSEEKDGSVVYLVPVAERKLVEVSNIKMVSPIRATIDMTWKWSPNQLGELLDAAGPMVKSFNTWDRATLIQKHGANFYHDPPTKVTLALDKTDKGWQTAME